MSSSESDAPAPQKVCLSTTLSGPRPGLQLVSYMVARDARYHFVLLGRWLSRCFAQAIRAGCGMYVLQGLPVQAHCLRLVYSAQLHPPSEAGFPNEQAAAVGVCSRKVSSPWAAWPQERSHGPCRHCYIHSQPPPSILACEGRFACDRAPLIASSTLTTACG